MQSCTQRWRYKCIRLRVKMFNPLNMGLDQLHRRNYLLPDLKGGLRYRQRVQRQVKLPAKGGFRKFLKGHEKVLQADWLAETNC